MTRSSEGASALHHPAPPPRPSFTYIIVIIIVVVVVFAGGRLVNLRPIIAGPLRDKGTRSAPGSAKDCHAVLHLGCATLSPKRKFKPWKRTERTMVFSPSPSISVWGVVPSRLCSAGPLWARPWTNAVDLCP